MAKNASEPKTFQQKLGFRYLPLLFQLMTKEKILSASSKLFFEKGIANVRLQQIADNVNISVGNLAYHYPNKQSIVESLYLSAFEELTQMTGHLFAANDFGSFDDSVKTIFRFQKTYNFCFNNAWEILRNYPQLNQQWKTINNRLQANIQKSLGNFVTEKLLIEEPFKAAYKTLPENILLQLHYWSIQQCIKGKPAPLLSFRKTTWALLAPYFTETGKLAYAELGID